MLSIGIYNFASSDNIIIEKTEPHKKSRFVMQYKPAGYKYS